MKIWAHPVFGSDRFLAACAAYAEWRNAVEAVDSNGGSWAPEYLQQRERDALAVRKLYAEYGDSLFA